MSAANAKRREWASGLTGRRTKETIEIDSYTKMLEEYGLEKATLDTLKRDKRVVKWTLVHKNFHWIPEELLKALNMKPDITLGGRDEIWDFDENGPAEYHELLLPKGGKHHGAE